MNHRGRSLRLTFAKRSPLYGLQQPDYALRIFSRTFTQCLWVNQTDTVHSCDLRTHPDMQQCWETKWHYYDRCTESYFRTKMKIMNEYYMNFKKLYFSAFSIVYITNKVNFNNSSGKIIYAAQTLRQIAAMSQLSI